MGCRYIWPTVLVAVGVAICLRAVERGIGVPNPVQWHQDAPNQCPALAGLACVIH